MTLLFLERLDRNKPPFDRWLGKVDNSGCWIWRGALTNNGYDRFKVGGKTVLAHRFGYEELVGSIPAGLTLDHLCRRPACVNPTHLEPVTMRVNVLRGDTITAANAAKLVCHKGHPLAGSNLFVRRDGRRRCRACEKAAQTRLRNTERYRRARAEYEKRRRAAKKEASLV